MAKWADYAITAVGYNASETRILQVEIRQDDGTKIGQPSRASRQQIVRAIEGGTTFVTAYLKSGKWHRGQDVHVVVIHGEKFIRTDRNHVKADNLGELPRLARAAS